MVLGSTQPLAEMSTTGMFLGGKERSARKADNLTAICEPTVTSTSHNPIGLHGLLQG
jgi:hypothetical protein